MALFNFIRGSDMSDQEIFAGLRDGTLQEWRVGADGEEWYKQSKLAAILGVPKSDSDAIFAITESDTDAAEYGTDEPAADYMADCIIRDADGTILAMRPSDSMHGVDPSCEVSFDIEG